MTSLFDLPTLHRHLIGYDTLFEELNRTFANSKSIVSYPPYNIGRLDENHYVVEVATAGFKENEIEVELKNGVLGISGEQSSSRANVEYLHKGISNRNFNITVRIAEDMEVKGATVKDGILSIALEHVIPEEKKAKKIAITYQK